MTFSDFLIVQGIHNQVEHENDGWGVWIHSEDELEKASELLHTYINNPNDARFQKHSRRAQEIKERERQEDEAAKDRTFDRTTVFRSSTPYRVGPLTFCLIVAACTATGLSWTDPDKSIYLSLVISQYKTGLREVMQGEVWRLFTPALLHGGPNFSPMGVLHLLLNMWFMVNLGSMIEGRESGRKLLSLVLIIGVLSNLAQWRFEGPYFVGMSGVAYVCSVTSG
jgi:GlpG protein